MATDKTGAPTTVTAGEDTFTIAVDGQKVGLVAFVDHGGQRIFLHTEVKDEFEGRGLASILVSEALAATREAGLRIVAVCPMVADYLDRHRDFDDLVDPLTHDTKRFLQRLQGG
ncbi:GNAT family N-acetyltransferase [Mycolicibacterium sphagni]|uniref:GNAT family N-acetyltransferase n=1 Tax=Mycolicibacterium sphagni TaxID=1786 RepID=A0A255DHV8_9MYCO|nr:GNAT family N-acetyltransferase [Mycolicibacterium sphagni]OYN78946.1 GNAT family N-acetyltransferase [Mycolicibacterium sphagni]